MSESNLEIATEADRGLRLLRSGRIQDAIAVGNDLIRRYRSKPGGWNLLSEINLRSGRLTAAVDCVRTAARLAPEEACYQLQLGRSLAMAGSKAEALSVVDRAAELAPEDAGIQDGIGAVYAACDEQSKAIAFFERAVAAQTDNAHFIYNLAAAQRMVGQLSEAERNCDRVIALKPQEYAAYYIRADLRRWTSDDNHIGEMESLLLSGIRHWRSEMTLRFALAKECDDIGDHEKSFNYVKSACDLQRSHLDYDVQDDVKVIEEIIRAHNKASLSKCTSGHDSQEPIFVLGLPRTGTTLVERIIGSHSQVYAAGELNNFAIKFTRAIADQTEAREPTKGEMVRLSLQLDFRALGSSYIESTRPRTGQKAHFIDKMPQNYLYCGLISRALPNAKIILLDRNPMDSCYAMYKTMFTGAYPFSYELGDLGAYYLAYRRLIDHWNQVLGDRMLIVRYEDLVTDTELTAQRLLEYCDLPWEDACLDFHSNAAPTGTASAVQVRQPVYSSSVDKWRIYASQLRPLTEVFEANGIQTGSIEAHQEQAPN